MWIAWWGCSGPDDSNGGPSDDAEPTADTAAAPSGPPNLLLVVLDDLGVERLGPYGAPGSRTPTLDTLASQGRVFRNAWGYPSCSPARAALLTGRHARRTGYGSNVKPPDEYRLDPGQLTIAEVLANAPIPYRSAFAGKWHLEESPDTWGGPRTQGWDWYAGSEANLQGTYFRWWKRDASNALVLRETYATTDTTDDVVELVTELPEPWFVTAAYAAPHAPFHVPPPDLATVGPGLGAQLSPAVAQLAMLEAWDTEFARLLAAFDPEVRARTWIVIAADNGDSVEDSTFDVDGGKVTLMDGGVHVPLIVVGPGLTAPGTPSDALVSLVDVLPTFAALAGVDVSTLRGVADPDAPLGLDGRSLLPTLLGDPAEPVHDVIVSEKFTAGPPPYEEFQIALRSRTHKLWRDVDGTEHLYVYDDEPTVGEPRELAPDALTPRDEAALAALRDALVVHLSHPWDASE
jgi:arylsulfatase B